MQDPWRDQRGAATTTSTNTAGTVAADGAKDLHAREGAGGTLGFVSEIAAEREGLRLGADELHERGGIVVHPGGYRSRDLA